MMYRLLSLLLISAIAQCLISQGIVVNYRQLGTQDGINFRRINAIHQDDSGLIWLGTDLGLQFYDGHDFLDYKFTGSGDRFSTVYDIEKDSQGMMYVSTSNGVFKFDESQRSFYSIDFSGYDEHPAIKKLILGPDDTLFAIGSKRAYRLNKSRFQPMEDFPVPEKIGFRNRYIYSDSEEEDYLVIMFDQFDAKYNLTTDKIESFKSRIYYDDQIRRTRTEVRFPMLIDGQVVVISSGGKEISQTTFEYKDKIFDKHGIVVRSSAVLGDKTLILDELSRQFLLYDNGEPKLILDIKNLDPLLIYDHHEDDNGDYFLATNFGLFVFRFSNSIFEIIDKIDDVRANYHSNIRKIVQTAKGHLLYTQGNMLKLNENGRVVSESNVGKPIMDYEGIGTDTYFALSGAGSKVISVVSGKVKVQEDLDVSGFVCHPLERSVLIGGKGLIEYNIAKDSVLCRIGSPDEIVRSICSGANGKIYVGSQNGLKEYNYNYEVVRRLSNQAVAEFDQANINDIYVDPNHNIWLATQGNGVLVLDSLFNIKKAIGKAEGLPNEVVYSINFDGEYFWFPTDYGLARYDRQSEFVMNYFEEDGISNNEFNRHSNLITDKGDIYLGTVNGLIKVNRKQPKRHTDNLKIFISDAYLKNSGDLESISIKQSIVNDKSIVIQERNGYAKVSFGVSEFMSPGDHKYAYRLSQEHSWIPLGNKNSVELINLSAGTYNLEVVGKSREGKEARTHLIQIISKAPFYKRWWFFVLMSVLSLLLMYQLYRWRLRQLKRVQKVKQNISKDLHDEVGSMLTEITILTDVARSVNDRGDQEQYLEQISQKGRSAISAMSDVIWTVDGRSSTLGDVVTKINQVMANLLTPVNISFTSAHTGLDLNKKLSLTYKKNLYLIVKEAIHNTVKHGNASKVVVDIARMDQGMRVTIKNDKNQNADHRESPTSNGMGIRSMNERANTLGGTLTITETEADFKVELVIRKW